jgi:hypothetical protein
MLMTAFKTKRIKTMWSELFFVNLKQLKKQSHSKFSDSEIEHALFKQLVALKPVSQAYLD